MPAGMPSVPTMPSTPSLPGLASLPRIPSSAQLQGLAKGQLNDLAQSLLPDVPHLHDLAVPALPKPGASLPAMPSALLPPTLIEPKA